MTVHTDHRKPTLRVLNPITGILLAVLLDVVLVWGLSTITGWSLLVSTATVAVAGPAWLAAAIWYDGHHPNL